MDKECNEIGKDVVGRSKTTKASPRYLLNFLKKDEPEVKKDEPTIQEVEDPLTKVREVILNIKNVETNMNVGRSMWNAGQLAEFNQSGWIQVDFAPLINYRRKVECRHIAVGG
jgi:putative AlgH/UPF0301 family transcriptional regulator